MARIVLEHESGKVVVAETTNMDNTEAVGPVNEQYWLQEAEVDGLETWGDSDGNQYIRTK